MKKMKKEKKKIDTSFAAFVKVTQYLTGKDVCFIILGVISSGFVGAVMPFIGIFLLSFFNIDFKKKKLKSPNIFSKCAQIIYNLN